LEGASHIIEGAPSDKYSTLASGLDCCQHEAKALGPKPTLLRATKENQRLESEDFPTEEVRPLPYLKFGSDHLGDCPCVWPFRIEHHIVSVLPKAPKHESDHGPKIVPLLPRRHMAHPLVDQRCVRLGGGGGGALWLSIVRQCSWPNLAGHDTP
jgi:hypothetical protein